MLCIGVLAIVAGGVGLLLGGIGYAVAKGSPKQSQSLPVTGIVVNLLAMVIGACWLFLLPGLFQKVDLDFDTSGEPLASLTAINLDEEYGSNELTADAQYKKKVLVVSGKIKKITRDVKPGQITVELIGIVQEDREPPNSTIDCNFDLNQANELTSFEVGQEIAIRGRCMGKIGGWVTVNYCSVENGVGKKENDPIVVTADELDDAYEGNALAADNKYKGKLLEVTGEVLRVSQNKVGKVTIELDTTTGSQLPV